MLTTVFEIRKKIIEAYGQYEYIIIPALKFCVAFLLILEIDSHIGFNLGLTNTLLGVIIALICSLVPVNFIAGILMVLVLAHLYTLSLETGFHPRIQALSFCCRWRLHAASSILFRSSRAFSLRPEARSA